MNAGAVLIIYCGEKNFNGHGRCGSYGPEKAYPSMGETEFDRMLKSKYYQALLPKWQRKLGALNWMSPTQPCMIEPGSLKCMTSNILRLRRPRMEKLRGQPTLKRAVSRQSSPNLRPLPKTLKSRRGKV
jgi:hypothetical protein